MFYLGLDFGTSGARACVLDEAGEQVFESRAAYADAANPRHWREALYWLIAALPVEIRTSLSALAIDGTSGTLLAADVDFEPVSPALLYNDGRAEAEALEACSAGQAFSLTPAPLPPGERFSPYGATSGLAKRLWLAQHFPEAAFCFHQADWLAALLTGKPGITEYHNALKSGYDVDALAWPDWVSALPGGHWQQTVLVPGEPIDRIRPAIATQFKINPACVVRAGTTDSIAAFIASGASRPGEAVTSLGTTLVLKLLSENRVEDPLSGVYSHCFGKLWLAGGASNSGGGVLQRFFSATQLAALSEQINPDKPSGLDYYPLPKSGERFPVSDPGLAPRMTPRPTSDAVFLQGLLEGIAYIEATGYKRLQELGASPPQHILTAGGGANNLVWQSIRQKILRIPVSPSPKAEAAYGTAMLAMKGQQLFP